MTDVRADVGLPRAPAAWLRRSWTRLKISVAVRVVRVTRRPIGVVIVFHGVSERRGDRARELVPAVAATDLRRLLAHLRGAYRVVASADMPDAVEGRGRFGRVPVALTFDDDLASHVHAGRLVAEAGVSATFFVGGCRLDHESSYWWDDLEALWSRRGAGLARTIGVTEPAGSDLRRAAAEIESLPRDRRSALEHRLAALAACIPNRQRLSAPDLRALLADGHDLGFHTLRHDALPTLDDDELDSAVREGLGRLETIAGRRLESFAYPHGKFDDRCASAVARSGFRRAFTTTPAAVTPRSDRHRLGRIDLGGLDWLAGAHAVAALTWSAVRRPP